MILLMSLMMMVSITVLFFHFCFIKAQHHFNFCFIVLEDNGVIDSDNFDPDELVEIVSIFWERRQSALLNDFTRAAYKMSPIPAIFAHANDPENEDIEDREAIDRLITKLLVDPALVGNEREIAISKLIDDFWEQHGYFASKQGFFRKNNI